MSIETEILRALRGQDKDKSRLVKETGLDVLQVQSALSRLARKRKARFNGFMWEAR